MKGYFCVDEISPTIKGILTSLENRTWREVNKTLRDNGREGVRKQQVSYPEFPHESTDIEASFLFLNDTRGNDFDLYESFISLKKDADKIHRFWEELQRRCEEDPEFKDRWDGMMVLVRLTDE